MSLYDQQPAYRSRRPSFSSGPAFGAGQGFPPYNDPFRQDGFNTRGQFGDPYGGFTPEVSGPPPGAPPPRAPSGPPSSVHMSNAHPPPPSPQPFPPSGGFGAFPPPGQMGTSYSMSTREQRPSPPLEPSGFEPTGAPPPRAAYPDSYDNSPLSDSYFPPPIDDGFGRGRTLSTGGGFGPPALLPPAPPMTPFPSQYSAKRGRRSSSIGPGLGMGMGMGMGMGGFPSDPYRRPGGVAIKFRLKGGYRQGVTLSEATDSARLSRSTAYSMHDLAPDMRGRITLKVRWAGFRSLTYEIPVSSDYDGYVNLQSLVRRIARAIVHFMTANAMTLSWDRVVLHRLEEIAPGIWIPVLTTH